MAQYKLDDVYKRYIDVTMNDGKVYEELFVKKTKYKEEEKTISKRSVTCEDGKGNLVHLNLDDVKKITYLDTVEQQTIEAIDSFLDEFKDSKSKESLELHESLKTIKKELTSNGHTAYQRKK